MSATRLRIVSDLHIGETGSRVQRLSALEPLFEGVERVVFNGDSLETRFLDLSSADRERKAAFDAFVAAQGARLILLTGNHDPDLSALHHLDLENGRVLVTHGDLLFPEMTPWGWEGRYFPAEHARRLAAVPASDRLVWETQLRICKEAIAAIRRHSLQLPTTPGRRFLRNLRFLLSSRLGWRVLRSWHNAPAAAARLAELYRPAARIVVVGHLHRPGCWQSRGRIVINTGSSLPPFGAQTVDIVDRRIELRRLAFRRGAIAVGAVIAHIDLDTTSVRTETTGAVRLPPPP